jgi:hypothetical protein
MAILNTPYLDAFPKVKYDINRGSFPVLDTVTNIFFRLQILKNVLSTATSYEVYSIQDGDTPEILAEKVYGDVGAGWIIMYANNIHNPLYDWPLDTSSFNRYIVGKYGSIENAKTAIHHYEKVITRTEELTGVKTVTRFEMTPERYMFTNTGVPYSYWVPFTSSTFRTADSDVYLADTDAPELLADLDEDGVFQQVIYGGSLETRQGATTHNINGKTVREEVRGEAITAYDYEVALNDDKRMIKVIKAEYYQQIMDEFGEKTGFVIGSFRRLAGLT